MADAPRSKVDGGAAGAQLPARVLTTDEELRLLRAHAELAGDLAAAARLQTACDPLEQTQENPDLPELLRSQDELGAALRRGGRARLRRARRIAAALLLVTGMLLLAASLLTGPA